MQVAGAATFPGAGTGNWIGYGAAKTRAGALKGMPALQAAAYSLMSQHQPLWQILLLVDPGRLHGLGQDLTGAPQGHIPAQVSSWPPSSASCLYRIEQEVCAWAVYQGPWAGT